jgi:hypothetical protein
VSCFLWRDETVLVSRLGYRIVMGRDGQGKSWIKLCSKPHAQRPRAHSLGPRSASVY